MKRLAVLLLAGVLAALPMPALTQPAPPAAAGAAPGAIDAGLALRLRQLAQDSAQVALAPGLPPVRIEVELGQLDPRLNLAPCERIEPYLPAGVQLTGRSRIGLRCLQGPSRWNVFLPVTVKIWARSLVAASALPGGTVLRASHLAEGEVDLAARTDPAITQPESALGRALARPLAAGEALRRADLKARQWFAAGDPVRVLALGPGFSISAEGQALGPGVEGQPTRVRTESGRIVTGMPTGDRRVEVPM